MNAYKILAVIIAVTSSANASVIVTDDFSSYTAGSIIDLPDWEQTWSNTDPSQRNLISGSGTGYAILDTSQAKRQYHLVNQTGFTLSAGETAIVRSDFRYSYTGGGNITENLNQGAFGFLLSNTPECWSGATTAYSMCNRGAAMGHKFPRAPWVDGWIHHTIFGVDTSTGGLSDWFTLEGHMTGSNGTVWVLLDIFDSTGTLLNSGITWDTGIPDSGMLYVGYSTGWNNVGADATINSFSRIDEVHMDNFSLEVLPVPGDTHYVDINCTTPDWPYSTWETAATTIHAAITAAGHGDTVLVADGTYNITTQIVLHKRLTVESLNGMNATTIDANGHCRVVQVYAHNGPVVIKGFTITGGHPNSGNNLGGGIAATGNGPVVISHCRVRNNYAPAHGGGIHVGGNMGMNFDVLISNCIVADNKAGIHGGGIHVPMWKERTGFIEIEDCIINGNECPGEGGGIRCFSIDGFTRVSRCLIANNTAELGGGVLLGLNSLITDSLIFGNRAIASSGGGIKQRYPHQSGIVINCTITGNQAATLGGGIHNQFIFNSVIWGNSAPEDPDIGPFSTISHSCSPALSPGIGGNINADPMFVNASGGDYRFLANSPCIDAGLNDIIDQPVDLGWHPRICDGDLDGYAVVDMGAYEFQCTEITIDIKPGCDINPINLKSKGVVQVAVLTTREFDASMLRPESIRFAGAAPVHAKLKPVDNDEGPDLFLHFRTGDLQLTNDSTTAYLIGQTHAGRFFVGKDKIRIVPGPAE